MKTQRIIPVLLLILFICSIATSCAGKDYPKYFSADINASLKKQNRNNEINYKEYIVIQINPSEIVKTDAHQIGSLKFNDLKYSIRIVNHSGKPIRFDCQVFFDPSFAEQFIESGQAVLCKNLGEFQIDSNEGYTINGIKSILDVSSADDKTKIIYHQLSQTFYFEFLIDGHWAYDKVDPTD